MRKFAGKKEAGSELRIAPQERPAAIPLSHAQQRLWLLAQMDGASGAYHMSSLLRLEGALDIDALKWSLDRLSSRHESLRTVFGVVAGVPCQRISDPQTPFALRQIDLRHATSDVVARSQMEEVSKPFDLVDGPPIRGLLIREDEARHVLVITIHHIVSDGWSLGIFIGELAALYGARTRGEVADLPEMTIQYVDYAIWQRRRFQGDWMQRELAYWREALSGAPELLALPTDRRRPPVQDYRGNSVPFALDPESSASLKAIANKHGMTPFMICLAAWAIVLSRLSGQTDIVIGTPVANRSRQELEGLIGFFANTLAIRLQPVETSTVAALLSAVKESVLSALEHQEMPFDQIVEYMNPSRSMAYMPMFQTMFTWEGADGVGVELQGLQVDRLELPLSTSKFDMSLFIGERDGRFAGLIEYATALFDAETAERYAGYVVEALRGMAATPYGQVADIDIMPAQGRERWLDGVRSTFDLETPVHVWFERRALACPDAPAVVFGEHTVGYGELNRRANRLAHHLINMGVGPDALVGICMARTPELVEAVLAVLKAGGAYVPLDPNYPAERIGGMLEDARPVVVLADAAGQAVLTQACARLAQPPRVLWPDTLPGSCPDLPDTDPDRAETGLRSDHLAYLIYTSGSTGRPKGVMIEHRGVANYLQYARDAYLHDRVRGAVVATPIGFDATVTSLMTPWLSGKAVVLLPEEIQAAMAQLLTWFEAREAWLFKLTPAHLDLLSDLAYAPVSNTPHIVVVGGEQLATSTLERFRTRVLPAATVVNEYGPTETVVGCVTHACLAVEKLPKSHAVPIGRPTANMRIYLLDARGRPVPFGATGEIYIGGSQMARGYLNRPDLTAERFVPVPFPDETGARMYRTGDFARLLCDGNLEYRGRNDQQVKIRGHRVELGEVEAKLVACAGVKDAVVLTREDASGQNMLVAYCELGDAGDIDKTSLHATLQTQLPDYMLPAAYVMIDRWPLTPNGKLDRDALPEPGEDAYRKSRYEAPRDALEARLATLWEDVLERERIGIQDNFFDAGGHSLLVMRLVGRLRTIYGEDITSRAVFEAPTIAAFAAFLRKDGRGGEMRISGKGVATPTPDTFAALRAEAGRELPLLPAQLQLWLFERLRPGTSAYNVGSAYRLRGKLDADAVERAFATVIARHDALRLSFGERGGQPFQIVHENVVFALRRVDMRDVPRCDVEKSTQSLLDESLSLPFDLTRAPLCRAIVMSFSEDDHVLVIVLHHIVSDAQSAAIFQDDLRRAYNADRAGTSETESNCLRFADIVVQSAAPERLRRLEDDIAYWTRILSGTTGLLDLPTDKPRTDAPSVRGARWQTSVPARVCDPFREFARGQRATSFMAFMALFQVLLTRSTGDTDIVVGTPVSDRASVGRESVVGMLINTVALRGDFSGDPSFRELLASTRDACLDAFDHAAAPIERVLERLNIERAPGRTPLFQVMFVLQTADGGQSPEYDGLTSVPIPQSITASRFELTLEVFESDAGADIAIDYNSDLFGEAAIARMGAQYVALLRNVLLQPETPLSRLDLLSADERAAVIALGDGGPALASQSDTLHGLFALQAARTPDAAALVEPAREWTYSQVLRRANGIAQALCAQDIGPGAYVAVLSDRSADAVIAVLGVLLAGAAYLPLDPTSPDERLQVLLQDAGAAALLVPPLLRARAATLPSGIPVLHADAVTDADAAPRIEVGAGDPAYLIYTSGSTGTPKGVVVEHRGAVNLVQGFLARHRFDDQRLLMIPPLIFDASVGDVFPALACGSALVLHPAPTELGPFELERFCREHRVTAIDAPAALWRRWSEGWATRTQREPLLPALNLMMIGGESVPVEQVRRFADATGGRVVLCNHYGPTEASVCATLLSTVDASEIASHDLPAGRPLPGVRIHLLDRHLQPVPRGVVGELFIGGDGVARGYHNAAELTSERFLDDPFSDAPGARMYRTGDLARWNSDDTLQFIGRRDHQIKLRGFRIELGEIDNALAALPGVQAVAVLLREDRPGDRRLVAYAVVADGVDAAALRAGLARRLPEAMLPSAFVFLDAMPLTANGKIDRRALPAPGEDAPAERAIRDPQTPTEHAVLAVWRDVLGRASLGADDDFFASGGDSLSTLPLVFKLHEALGVELPLSAVFATPTVVGLSATIDRMLAGEAVEVFDIEAQVALPESIDSARVAPPVAPRVAPKSVLLTGATGFLGAYVLRDLIDLSAAEVVCLVRADSAEDGVQRIRRNLESYGLWREGDAARLVPVLGDLSSPLLGLTPSAFEALAQRVDAIVHNGGQVNFIAPYAHLEAANVGGTREVLRLATTAHLKPVQLVSTLGVYVTRRHSGQSVAETHAPPDGPGQDGGYNQSKWVSEQLGLLARARGVPLAIHRPARITGDGVSGISNPGDYFNAWIRGCVQLGKAPHAPDDFFDMTPVDYVARTIVRVMLGAGDANGNYHYFNPHTLPVTDAVAAIRERVCPIEEVDYRQWRQALMASIAAGEDNALKPFAGLFAEPVDSAGDAAHADPMRIPVFDCSATEAIGAPWGERCLPADRTLFERYLRFLQSRGALPSSAGVRA